MYPLSNELKSYVKEKQRIRDKGLDFEALPPGFSYAIPLDQCNMSSLNVQCSRQGKRLGRIFKMYYHSAAHIVEVGRIDGINKVDTVDSLSTSIE
jgi:hypothetical protein